MSVMIKFSPEMYADYQRLYKPIFDFYPLVFVKDRPLPVDAKTEDLIRTDPYIQCSEEEFNNFFTIWCARREYTASVCKFQVYFNDVGIETDPIPLDIIADRARHLARFSDILNMSDRSWKGYLAKNVKTKKKKSV